MMYGRDNSPDETAKKICSALKIPQNNCQQLSADRVVCLVSPCHVLFYYLVHDLPYVRTFERQDACVNL